MEYTKMGCKIFNFKSNILHPTFQVFKTWKVGASNKKTKHFRVRDQILVLSFLEHQTSNLKFQILNYTLLGSGCTQGPR